MKRAWLLLLLLPALLFGVRQATSRQPLDRLREDIGRTTASVNATWGIYVKSLETGEEIAVDADRPMETMSTIKIPLMVEVFAQAREGRLRLGDRYTLRPGDVVAGGGVLENLEPGVALTVKDLVTLMITVSDNTAADVLFRLVGGPEAVNRRMAALGLKHTRVPQTVGEWFAARRFSRTSADFYRSGEHRYGVSTPREMGQLLERMERGTLVDEPSSEEMLRILRKQFYRSRIPRLVTDYRIPHKSGTFPPYVAVDVGVLEARNRTVVVSIFTADHFGALETLDEAIAVVAKQVADYYAYRD